MQIVIIGCGKVGKTLVAQLVAENHNITVIDTDPEVVEDITELYDVLGIVGNGTSNQILQSADIEHTDVLIAVTDRDEVNLLCCVIAKQKSTCHTIARVRNPIYSAERHFLRHELQLSLTINPEQEAAREIARLLQFPNAVEIDSFAQDRIDMLRQIAENRSWMRYTDIEMRQKEQPKTYKTLCMLRDLGEEPSLLLGADKLQELEHLWKNIPEIAEEFGIVCMDRGEINCEEVIRNSPFLTSLHMTVIHVPPVYKDFSSTLVRDSLTQLYSLQQTLQYLLPPELKNLPADLLLRKTDQTQ